MLRALSNLPTYDRRYALDAGLGVVGFLVLFGSLSVVGVEWAILTGACTGMLIGLLATRRDALAGWQLLLWNIGNGFLLLGALLLPLLAALPLSYLLATIVGRLLVLRLPGIAVRWGVALAFLNLFIFIAWEAQPALSRALLVKEVAPARSLPPLQQLDYVANREAGDYSVGTWGTTQPKVTIVMFWSTWHVGSLQLLDEVNTFYRKHANDPALMVLAVNPYWRGNGRDTVEAFVARSTLALPILHDSTHTYADSCGVTDLPGLIVVDDRQRIRYRLYRYSRLAAIQTVLEELVGELRK